MQGFYYQIGKVVQNFLPLNKILHSDQHGVWGHDLISQNQPNKKAAKWIFGRIVEIDF